jgi:phage gp36-like protein
MAYTTVDNVKSMFRGIEIEPENVGSPEENTAVTTEEVERFIDEVDAEINGLLYDYYDTPITGTNALLIVGRISTYKVAHIIKTILEATNENSDKKADVQTNLEKKANEMIDQIIPHWDQKCCEWIDPRLPLTDASMKAVSPKTAAVFDSSVHEPVIKKGGNNW